MKMPIYAETGHVLSSYVWVYLISKYGPFAEVCPDIAQFFALAWLPIWFVLWLKAKSNAQEGDEAVKEARNADVKDEDEECKCDGYFLSNGCRNPKCLQEFEDDAYGPDYPW